MLTAIDIGSESIKVVSLRMKNGSPVLVGAGLGTIRDFDRNSDDYLEQVAAVLRRVIRKHAIPIGRVIIGLGGRGSMIRYLGVPAMPAWKLSLHMGLEVEEQLGSAGDLGQIASDFRVLNLPDYAEGMLPIFLALAQVPVIEDRLQITRLGCREARDVGLSGLAAFNLFRFTPQCRNTELSLLLDIGAEETHLTIQQGDQLYFARTLSWGSRHITTRIQKELRLLPSEADNLKCSDARIIPLEEEEFYAPKIVKLSRLCRSETAQLMNGMHSTVRFFQKQCEMEKAQPERIYLTGGGAKLLGLPAALSLQIRREVELLELTGVLLPTKGRSHAVLTSDVAPVFATTTGMALAALTDGFGVTLLPPAVKDRQDFWTRRVYAIYIAVVAVAVLAMFVFLYRRDALAQVERTARAKQATESMRELHNELDTLKRKNKNWYRQVAALQKRHDSPVDLFVSLAHLRAYTPNNIFYNRLTTTRQAWNSPTARKAQPLTLDLKNSPPIPLRVIPAVTLQDERAFLLEGYVIGSAREEDARKVLTRLVDKLDKLQIFSRVSTIRSQFLPSEDGRAPPEVSRAYQSGFGGKLARRQPPRRGALKFRLQFDLRDPLAAEK